MAVIEEELGDQEVQTRVHFALQVVEVDGGIAAFDVLFGVGGAADADMVAMSFADEGDEFIGVGKAALDGGEGGRAAGRVAAEGEDVVDAGGGDAVEDGGHFVAIGADAGEVGHGFDADFLADAGDDIDGLLADGAAGPPGDGDEGGLEFGEFGDGAFELGDGLVGTGREEFEGDGRWSRGETVPDQH